MMKKILVNGTLLAAVALGLAGCMAKKTERCQLGFFDNLNSAKKVANKILKKSPKSAMALYKGQRVDESQKTFFLYIFNLSKDQCRLLANDVKVEYYISSMGEPSFPKKLCYIAMDNCKTAINQADKIFKGKKWSQEKSTYCDNGKCEEYNNLLVKNHHCTIDEEICENIGWNETLVTVYNAEKK
jgi:hypothetical protein